MDAPYDRGPLRVREATRGDADFIGARMRAADVEECRAAADLGPVAALRISYEHADRAWTLLVDGEPAMMFGLRAEAPDGGVTRAAVWALGTPKATKYRLPFLRLSRQWADWLAERYDVLFNFVDARNEEHVRWLAWLGFTFTGVVPEYGVAGIPFIGFSRAG